MFARPRGGRDRPPVSRLSGGFAAGETGTVRVPEHSGSRLLREGLFLPIETEAIQQQ